MARIGIVGATGYTGVELLRLLVNHPEVSVDVVTSRAEAGRPVVELFPSLTGLVDVPYAHPETADLAACDLVFFATPTGTAMNMAKALLDAGVKVVDLSTDFRLKDVALWEEWYGMTHCASPLVAEAIYGLPEVNRDAIRTARLVANPGCYPTAVQLGFIPLLEKGLVNTKGLIADAKSGVSGAGRKQSIAVQFSETSDSLKAYGASGHRHLPEITQGLSAAAGESVELTFVPHLTPMIRGIHATLYGTLLRADTDVQEVFEERFQNEPFVDVLPANSHPDTRHVRGSNRCQLSWHRPGDGLTLVILVVEDNLVKGAAGQAVQNMNLMLGFNESAGLNVVALSP